MPGCYQSSPTPPDSSPGHLEMSLLGARGMLQGWDPSPGALGWVQGHHPKAAPILWKPRTRVMLTLGSAPSATRQGDVGIVPTSLGAELFN